MRSFSRALYGVLAEFLKEFLVEPLVELRAKPLVKPLTQFGRVLFYNNFSLKLNSIFNFPSY